GGVDFRVNSGQLMITAKIDEDPENPQIFADNIFLGVSKYTQDYLPIMIDVAGQRLVDMTAMGSGSPVEEGRLERATQTINWNGRLDTGAFVDSGTYIIRVRAEGADGLGISTDEAVVNVTTPFDFNLKSISPMDKEFSTIGAPDRVSVYYTVSKDSIISANVYKSNGEFVAKLLEGEEVLGVDPGNPHVVSWRGNYPEPDSGLLAAPGDYKISLTAAAKDGTETKTLNIDEISVRAFHRNEAVVKLEPVGEDVSYFDGSKRETIKFIEGDAPFFVEAKGLGSYHPPKDFSYTLTANGKQKITAYPNVPFAGLMHRGFREVDTKVKVIFKIYGWNHYLGCEDNWLFGKWWNPWKWRRENEVREEVRWIEADALPGGGKGVVFKTGNEEKKFSFDFNTNDWCHQSGWDDFYGKPNPGSGIDSIAVRVEVYTKDSSFGLDATPIDTWVSLESSSVTSKGIFSLIYDSGNQYITHDGTQKSDSTWIDKSYGAYNLDLTLKLEAPITYSRLTNRFVPWIGFINAKTPLTDRTKDFTTYLGDIQQGLGFPGKLFFDDPEAKPGESYEPIDDLDGENWEELVSSLNARAAEANLLGYKDSLDSSVGYDSYLSDEYYEFIPITGDFDYNDNSPIVKVGTKLVYPYDGKDGPISWFDFNWPASAQEKSDFYDQQLIKRRTLDKELGGEPQNYTGTSQDGTWWELDDDQFDARLSAQNNSRLGSGQVRFNKTQGKSIWSTSEINGLFLPAPDYVDNLEYSVESNTDGITASLSSSGKNGVATASDNGQGIDWTTKEDLTLASTDGLIKAGPLTFNQETFSSQREFKISQFYQVSNVSEFPAALKYTFLKKDPYGELAASPLDNPNLEITDWEVKIKDKTGGENKDLILTNVDTTTEKNIQSHYNNDKFKLKLELKANESRFVEILGSAPDAYDLLFFDGNNWQNIFSSSQGQTGRLAWWDISRLNGKHTLLLKSQGLIATTDVHIGTLIKENQEKSAWSVYKRAELKFPAGAFGGRDHLVTLTPVTMTEVKIRNRPILMTHGPIVEIKPSPWIFPIEPID
ncbi:MAG: hypothetical protein KJ811_01980, partial [Candidatus Margulisbacteria bacterium]|nr:hypothetical protein [Candidatus Margulisiibacteriota bacterium]